MKFLAALAMVLGLAACSTTGSGARIDTQSDPSAPFGTYKTFSWVTTENQEGVNPFLSQGVRDAITAQLIAKGYTQATSGDGDFAIAFTFGARDRIRVDSWGPYRTFYPGWGVGRSPRGWVPAYRETDVRQITEGSLAIDFFDAKTRRPVWHGHATKNISGGVDQERVNMAVAELLADFPAAASAAPAAVPVPVAP